MSVRSRKIGKKTVALRDKLWPDLDVNELWDRSDGAGFTSIPRTMPIILSIIDQLCEGKRTSAVYFTLWCRAFEEMYVSLQNAEQLAHHSGFTGQRAVRTWKERIKELDDLGFIRTAPGATDRSHVVIPNPHYVVRRLKAKNTPGLTQNVFNALVERALEVGAEDMEIELPEDRKVVPFSKPSVVPPAEAPKKTKAGE